VAYHSALDASLGDGIVLGATTIEQSKSNLAFIEKGPVDKGLAAKIDTLWEPGVNPVLDNWEAIKGVKAGIKANEPMMADE
jgi:hypothetical protein